MMADVDGEWTPSSIKSMVKENADSANKRLVEAAKAGNVATMSQAWESGASVAAALDMNGESALHNAAGRGHVPAIEWLMQHGADLAAKDQCGAYPLHCAARRDHVLAMESLVDHGAELDSINSYGDTALHAAAHNGQARAVEWLVGRGLDPATTDARGQTVLHFAVQRGYLAIAEWLAKQIKDSKTFNAYIAVAHRPTSDTEPFVRWLFSVQSGRKRMLELSEQLLQAGNGAKSGEQLREVRDAVGWVLKQLPKDQEALVLAAEIRRHEEAVSDAAMATLLAGEEESKKKRKKKNKSKSKKNKVVKSDKGGGDTPAPAHAEIDVAIKRTGDVDAKAGANPAAGPSDKFTGPGEEDREELFTEAHEDALEAAYRDETMKLHDINQQLEEDELCSNEKLRARMAALQSKFDALREGKDRAEQQRGEGMRLALRRKQRSEEEMGVIAQHAKDLERIMTVQAKVHERLQEQRRQDAKLIARLQAENHRLREAATHDVAHDAHEFEEYCDTNESSVAAAAVADVAAAADAADRASAAAMEEMHEEMQDRYELLEQMYQPVQTENEQRKQLLADNRKTALDISRSRQDLDLPTKRMGELDMVLLGRWGITAVHISELQATVCDPRFYPWRVAQMADGRVSTVADWSNDQLAAIVGQYERKGCSIGDNGVAARWPDDHHSHSPAANRSGRGKAVAEEVLRCSKELQQWNASGGYCVTIPYHHGEKRELQPAELLKLAVGIEVPGCRAAPPSTRRDTNAVRSRQPHAAPAVQPRAWARAAGSR
jgi:hypothetical protein